MISGLSSETTYEQTENLNPGKTSSVTAAPPSTCRRSRTSTFLPARARYAALTRPLCPPPITTTSYFLVSCRKRVRILIIARPDNPRYQRLIKHAYRNSFSRTHVPALRESELSRVVWLLCRQLL